MFKHMSQEIKKYLLDLNDLNHILLMKLLTAYWLILGCLVQYKIL